MKIFVSSVRSGLELERDALPGLIKALGHEPVRFEDFTAQAIPSRQACIQGVEASDAYLLVLGASYGHVFPETGHSATHDEWITAQRIGIPRYVFRKTGIELEVKQAEFEATLGDYGSGRFYKTFADVSELQQAVAGSIRELENAPSTLDYQPLTGAAPAILWLETTDSDRGFSGSTPPLLEIHVAPVDGQPLSARLLEQVLEGLPVRVRASGLVSSTEALTAEHVSNNQVLVRTSAAPTGRWGESHPGSLVSVGVHSGGQIDVSFRLPGDQMGAILDPQDVVTRVASALRLAGQVDVSGAIRVTIGIGLSSTSMMSIGQVHQASRNGGSVRMDSSPVHIEPDETMSRSALDRGADEVAASLARTLLRAFTQTR